MLGAVSIHNQAGFQVSARHPAGQSREPQTYPALFARRSRYMHRHCPNRDLQIPFGLAEVAGIRHTYAQACGMMPIAFIAGKQPKSRKKCSFSVSLFRSGSYKVQERQS